MRHRAKSLAALVQDPERVREEREKVCGKTSQSWRPQNLHAIVTVKLHHCTMLYCSKVHCWRRQDSLRGIFASGQVRADD